MDRISYAGESLLTGTGIARALFDYAQALAEVGSSGSIEIPTIDANGHRGTSALLVGPSSQIVSTSIATDLDEVEDPALVSRLTELAAGLRAQGGPAQHPHVEDVPPGVLPAEYGI
ncbi:hypothetical protein [Microbacterium flavum]|uniref:Uncharacterized protein n=1 Tax=Microbacterium flavum TaxID=415216 RepID=A0ABS5XRU0_9MICO|nr:hypothetical protein [Microbacterium flavum]MBT8797247.1 hypothetical protein [Microbacterium flavum]